MTDKKPNKPNKPKIYHRNRCNAEVYLNYDYDRDEWWIPMPIGDIYHCPTCGVKLMTHEDYVKLAKNSISDNPVLEINNNGLNTNVTIDGMEISEQLASVRFIHDTGNVPDVILEHRGGMPKKIQTQLRLCNVVFNNLDYRDERDQMHEEIHYWIGVISVDRLIKEKCPFCKEEES